MYIAFRYKNENMSFSFCEFREALNKNLCRGQQRSVPERVMHVGAADLLFCSLTYSFS